METFCIGVDGGNSQFRVSLTCPPYINRQVNVDSLSTVAHVLPKNITEGLDDVQIEGFARRWFGESAFMNDIVQGDHGKALYLDTEGEGLNEFWATLFFGLVCKGLVQYANQYNKTLSKTCRLVVCAAFPFDEYDSKPENIKRFKEALVRDWHVVYQGKSFTFHIALEAIKVLPQPELAIYSQMIHVEMPEDGAFPILRNDESWIVREDGSLAETFIFDGGGGTCETMTYRVNPNTGKFMSFNVSRGERIGFWYTAIETLRNLLVSHKGSEFENVSDWDIAKALETGSFKGESISILIDQTRDMIAPAYIQQCGNTLSRGIAGIDRFLFVGGAVHLLKSRFIQAFKDDADTYNIQLIFPEKPRACAVKGAFYGAISLETKL